MPDRFTEVTTTSYGKRVQNSFGGIIIGFILFVASFFVLYNNEGSVDYSNIAKTAVEVDSATVTTDAAHKDKLLVTRGELTSDGTLGDDLYLKPGKYAALERKAEMFAWEETKHSDSKENLGGSETTTTTYDYGKTWTSDPESSSSFKYPEEHQNPAMEVKKLDKRVEKAKVGAYDVEISNIALPSLESVTLNTENIVLKDNAVLSGDYIFISKTQGSTLNAPVVGDVRISYSAMPLGKEVTVFGKLSGSTLGSYVDKDNNRFFQMFTGTKEDAFASLHSSYVTSKWIWRGVGFAMMWIGLSMIVAPISTILKLAPFLGDISGFILNLAAFIIALVLSGITILASMLFHSPIAIVVAIIVVGAAVFMVLKSRQSGKSVPGMMSGTPEKQSGLPSSSDPNNPPQSSPPAAGPTS